MYNKTLNLFFFKKKSAKMKNINIKQTIIRTLLIFVTTILLGSLGYTIVFSFIGSSYFSRIFETFWVFAAISAMFSSPSLLIIFFGLRYIYTTTDSVFSRYLNLFFLGIITSVIILFIAAAIDDNIATIGSGYTIAAVIATILVPYFKGDLKKKKTE